MGHRTMAPTFVDPLMALGSTRSPDDFTLTWTLRSGGWLRYMMTNLVSALALSASRGWSTCCTLSRTAQRVSTACNNIGLDEHALRASAYCH